MRTLIGLLATTLLTAGSADAQDSIQVPTDQSLSVRVADLPTGCAGSERLHVRVAGRDFSFDRGSVVALTPLRIAATGHIDRPDEMLMELPALAGCPGAPFEAVIVQIDPGDTALPLGLVLAAQSTGPFQSMAGLRDSGRCPALDHTRVSCVGSTQVGEQTVEVVAVIASDPTARTADGTPLFVICEGLTAGYACEASGARGGVGFKAVIETPDLPSVDLMRLTYERIDTALGAWAGSS